MKRIIVRKHRRKGKTVKAHKRTIKRKPKKRRMGVFFPERSKKPMREDYEDKFENIIVGDSVRIKKAGLAANKQDPEKIVALKKEMFPNFGSFVEEDQYKYVSGVIRNKRSENEFLVKEIRKLKEKQEEVKTIQDYKEVDEMISIDKKRLVNNQDQIEHLNKKYFPKNPR